MKNRSVTLSLLTATLFAIPALAADAPVTATPPPPPGQGPQGPWREEIMKRFDQDGDGKLSDAERAEARKAGEKMRAEMKEKFDANHDGQLDDTERQAAREAMRGKWAERGGSRRFHGPQGFGGSEPPPWMRRELHRWFEQQWSGHPGPGPRRAHGPASPHGLRDRIHAALVKRFDADGDGKLSDAERAEAKKAGKERHAHMKENRQAVLARFDKDGDGKLGEAERKDLREAWQKFIQAQPVVKPVAK